MWQIDQQNSKAADEDKLNLKGMMVGNGVTNWTLDCEAAGVEIYHRRAFMSDELYDKMQAEGCDYSYIAFGEMPSDTCLAYYNEMSDSLSNIDPYNIYGHCWNPSEEEPDYFDYEKNEMVKKHPVDSVLVSGKDGPKSIKKRKGVSFREYTKFSSVKKRFPTVLSGENQTVNADNSSSNGDCSWGAPLEEYFNRADVKSALHIPDYIQEFAFCSDINFTMLKKGSQWIWEEMKGKYEMMHYSGDKDSVVGTYGTLGWINALGWDVTDEWKPFKVDG